MEDILISGKRLGPLETTANSNHALSPNQSKIEESTNPIKKLQIQEISSRGRNDPDNAKIKIIPYSSPTPKEEDHVNTMRLRGGLKRP